MSFRSHRMQRSVIQFAKANPLQSMTALEQAISLPHEYAPSRYPSFPALERTAVMSFNVPKTLGFPTGATELKGALFRQAAWPLWVDTSVTSWIQVLNYPCLDVTVVGNNMTNSNTNVSFPAITCPVNSQVSNSTASSTTLGISGAVAPAWNWPLLGFHLDKGYTYVPKGATLAFHVGVQSKSASMDVICSVSLATWIDRSAESFTEMATVTITGTNLGVMSTPTVATENVWVRVVALNFRAQTGVNFGEIGVRMIVTSASTLTFSPSASTLGTVQVGGETATLMVPFSSPPEFDVTERPWLDTRVTAAALLLTNVTKVLNKEGTVLAGRLKNTAFEAWSFDSTRLASLHPAEKAMLALETGFYTYAPPSTDLQGFYNYTYSPATYAPTGFLNVADITPVFNLDNDSYANCFILTDSDASTPSSFAANLDWHVEFRNNSTLFPIGMSGVTLEAFHQAILNLVSHGFFFSNNKHKSALRSIYASGRKYAPLLLGALPPPARIAATMGMKVADRMLTKKPNTTPPTTSASGSGMTSGSKQKSKPKPKAKRGRH